MNPNPSVNLTRRTLGWFLGAALCLGVALPTTARAAAMPDTPKVAAPAQDETAIDRAMKAVVAISPQDEAARKQNGDTEAAGGSGFVIHASGLILTNAHVVAKLDTVEVTFANGKRYQGKVIGRDGRTDLAIVKIEADGPLPVLKLAKSSKLPLGAKVFALGNPMGNRFSVTSGIISGYDRAYDVAWPVNFIQHDAALNPGNSGGAADHRGGGSDRYQYGNAARDHLRHRHWPCDSCRTGSEDRTPACRRWQGRARPAGRHREQRGCRDGRGAGRSGQDGSDH
ncbi:S1C family serine protease [Sphingomonas sp. J344]|uniref:S1C family serine protease n=1 Tax=Sphingomonas sp. J344 TaxID=2898434 RepID=UPI0021511297|nr:S1C family serine protease [Sphingomonas sp. J344]MCR5871076.1 S1C family serine protease [Sphingomonas sp. J344]